MATKLTVNFFVCFLVFQAFSCEAVTQREGNEGHNVYKFDQSADKATLEENIKHVSKRSVTHPNNCMKQNATFHAALGKAKLSDLLVDVSKWFIFSLCITLLLVLQNIMLVNIVYKIKMRLKYLNE